MIKLFFILFYLLMVSNKIFAQVDVPLAYGGPMGLGSWLRFTSSGNDATSIQENWGLNLSGSNTRPVKIPLSSLLVGYQSSGQDFGVYNVLVSGNIGIGTISPATNLHIKSSGQTATVRLEANGAPAYGVYTITRTENNNGTGLISYMDAWGLSNTQWGANNKVSMNLNAGGDAALTLYTSQNFATVQFNTNGITYFNGGNVGIGTGNPDQKLTVNGTIHAKQVLIDLNVPAPDYVFEKNYKLKTLAELNRYVAINKHLPEIPTASELKKSGINVTELNMKLLKKVEELTLYLIEKDKEIKEVQAAKEQQQVVNHKLEQRIKILENVHK